MTCLAVFTARRYASALYDVACVCTSVGLSVYQKSRLYVFIKTEDHANNAIRRPGELVYLGEIPVESPSMGSQIEVGSDKIGYFRRTSHYISETVQDRGHQGMSTRLPAIFLQEAAKSENTHWMGNRNSSRVLKIDIPSVIDVNKNKNKHIGKREFD